METYAMNTKKFYQKYLQFTSFISLSTQMGFKAVHKHVKFLNFVCFSNIKLFFNIKSPNCH